MTLLSIDKIDHAKFLCIYEKWELLKPEADGVVPSDGLEWHNLVRLDDQKYCAKQIGSKNI